MFRLTLSNMAVASAVEELLSPLIQNNPAEALKELWKASEKWLKKYKEKGEAFERFKNIDTVEAVFNYAVNNLLNGNLKDQTIALAGKNKSHRTEAPEKLSETQIAAGEVLLALSGW